MNEKKTPAELVWTDGDGDRLWVRPPALPPTRSAAYVCASELGVFLTAAQCREVAAHFTALADAHEREGTPMTATGYADQEAPQ